MEPVDFLGAFGEMAGKPPARAEPSTTSLHNSLFEGIEESPLVKQIFWPLILSLMYFCLAMLLGAALT